VQVTLCSAASSCSEQSAVRYTHVSTQLHDRTAVAVHSLLPYIQSLSVGSTEHQQARISPIPLHRYCNPNSREFRKIYQHHHHHLHIRRFQHPFNIFAPNILKKFDIVEPTLRVTAHNLPYNSGIKYSVLKVTLCNTAQFYQQLIFLNGV